MTEMPPRQWTIEDAQVEDAESLSRMHAQSWRDTYIGIQPGITEEWVEERVAKTKESPEAIERYRSHMEVAANDPDHWLYKLAKGKDGEVVGFVLASKVEDVQHVRSFYVDVNFQGSGLAQDLAGCLTDWLDTDRDTILEVAANNPRAQSFYERLGFEVSGSKNDPGDGLVELTMIKPGVKNEV